MSDCYGPEREWSVSMEGYTDPELRSLDKENRKLEAENKRLREALEYHPGRCKMLSLGDVCDCILCKQSKEIDRLQPDASRYRWLRSQDPLLLAAIAWRVKAATHHENCDDAIDAAISAEST